MPDKAVAAAHCTWWNERPEEQQKKRHNSADNKGDQRHGSEEHPAAIPSDERQHDRLLTWAVRRRLLHRRRDANSAD